MSRTQADARAAGAREREASGGVEQAGISAHPQEAMIGGDGQGGTRGDGQATTGGDGHPGRGAVHADPPHTRQSLMVIPHDVALVVEEARPGTTGVSMGHIRDEEGLSERVPQTLRFDVTHDLHGDFGLAEPQAVYHFTRLSQKNFGNDTALYPLGSCTMKHNPKCCDEVAGWSMTNLVHPDQDPRTIQGHLEVFYELERWLGEVTGMDAVTLQPAAGAQGELLGCLLARAYHASRGESRRDEVILPDTAHGTNPATAGMAGYKVVEIPSRKDGRVDLDALAAAVSDRTALFMLTNPNTLGLFEQDIQRIQKIVHEAGGLLYYDGANLNAIQGVARPGDMGFDIVHINLHKTYAVPHGGGGPGAGPVGVKKRLEPFLPVPRIVRRDAEPGDPRGERTGTDSGTGSSGARPVAPATQAPASRTAASPYVFDVEWGDSHPQTIGKIKAWYGQSAALVRAYTYMCLLGGDGITRAAQIAVLNANYVKKRLEGVLDFPHPGPHKHEFVASASSLKKTRGVSAGDIGKRLLDYGIHAPTVYFPLIVPEALMFEPTESESREELDRFVDAMRAIASEEPGLVQGAPYTTPVRRLDEATAARRPVLRWHVLDRIEGGGQTASAGGGQTGGGRTGSRAGEPPDGPPAP